MFLAIVPAYNEEKTIGSVVRNLLSHVDRVVVVDDGSVDATRECALDTGAVVLRHSINRGQGASLETGHEYARRVGADLVLHFDADGQFDPNDIEGAVETLRESKADILFGSRFLDGRSTTVPWMKRHIVFPVARRFEHLFFGLLLSDVHNGFRLLTRSALGIIRITHDRMAHASEISSLVHSQHLRFVEYPVKVVYREYGQGISAGISILRDLFFGRLVK